MKRRNFIKGLTFSGLTASLPIGNLQAESLAIQKEADLVAVMGGEPDVMLRRALEEMGGIGKYVKKGNKVVVKPNIGWDKAPEMAANTNPILVKELIKQCFSAGASEVLVFDHTCDNWQRSYKNSGIEDAVKEAGGKIVPGNDESMYKEVDFPKAVTLKKAKIHQALLDCDVWFNVPVLKNHGGAKMTISMKNLMGIVWDRQFFHRENLDQCIADSCTFIKKPALNIVDAYRVVKTNGPQGRSEADVATLKTLLVSPDFVAIDTAAIKFFNQVQEMDLNKVGYIAKAESLGIGVSDLDKLNVKRIKL
ncbi:MAG TPA: DUF362 domain-containing protein [Candidatus Gallibacteroides avistercoris]|uniref:DUF362 domain-containing protein n=1 Tax=Candidatus Gallibacteroides avistercoris TaxID=2840833 RepID=A0A9D1M836_9BACT|nr:DUF362 domain-containing protein [Candidatus Gallibacteroides avistercoris]